MNSTNENRFKKVTNHPRWEGIIFTDLDFGDQRISISTIEPIYQLKEYIEYIWFMKWDLKSNESLQYIVAPNPCAKLVALQQNDMTFPALVVGAKIEAGLFELRGAGATVGFDFKPGGLFAIFEKSMNDWPESGIKVDKLVKDLPLFPKETWTETSLSKWVDEVDHFLIKLLSCSRQNNYKKINSLVEGTLNGSFKNSEDMALEAGVSIRSLQRIFQDEVGITPRDLLRIARFNEAIQKIGQDDFKAFADVALESGFFDQPHMANEFQKLVATSPSKFRRYL